MKIDLERYSRHLSLPGFTIAQQETLSQSRILVVGAGGLGAAALPALAGAGIGHITIVDHDKISRSNLHRQTIYKDDQVGQSKAECAAEYLRELNPDIDVVAVEKRMQDFTTSDTYDLVLDGTDNFAAKVFLNGWSIENATPLISASVHQFSGQCGIFAGHLQNAPCYHCLYPALPDHAPDCSTAGVLGTAAGLMGLYQAHLALLFLLQMNDTKPGLFISMDFLDMRLSKITIPKDADCKICGDKKGQEKKIMRTFSSPPLLAYGELPPETIVIDVRELEELDVDPIPNALHIPLMEIPNRLADLPQNKPIAFVCAGNIRSRHAADYVAGLGFSNVFVLDKFSL